VVCTSEQRTVALPRLLAGHYFCIEASPVLRRRSQGEEAAEEGGASAAAAAAAQQPAGRLALAARQGAAGGRG